MKCYTPITISIICLFLLSLASPLYAAGEIRKLKGISDDMEGMNEQLHKEGLSYKKADAFLQSAEIKQGLTGDDIIKNCGEPTAKADEGRRWVYKPLQSTFFRGEKIYFYFDGKGSLIGWEKVCQK